MCPRSGGAGRAPGPTHPRFSSEVAADFYARLDSATWARVGGLHASLATADDPRAVCEEISSILPGAYLADPESVDRRDWTGDLAGCPLRS